MERQYIVIDDDNLQSRFKSQSDDKEKVDFEKMTFIKIKEWGKKNNIPNLNRMRKAVAIQYINGILEERSKNVGCLKASNRVIKDEIVAVYETDNVLLNVIDTNVPVWLSNLRQKGWTVVPLVEVCEMENYVNQFFEWYTSCCPEFDRTDLSQINNQLGNNHGIIKNYFGHTEFQWKLRELCVSYFSKIHEVKEEDLVCSYDGGSILIKSEKDKSYSHWFHTDQGRAYPTLKCNVNENEKHLCVQGVVNFRECSTHDGGLVLIEEEECGVLWTEYMASHPSYGMTWGSVDFEDPIFRNKRIIKICAQAGSLILFDSRMFHCNIKPTSDNFRMCIYVSMQPRTKCNNKELKKKIKLYEEGRMTGHWCYGSYFNATPQHPRKYAADSDVLIQPDTIQIASCENNTLRRRLIGYDN